MLLLADSIFHGHVSEDNDRSQYTMSICEETYCFIQLINSNKTAKKKTIREKQYQLSLQMPIFPKEMQTDMKNR